MNRSELFQTSVPKSRPRRNDRVAAQMKECFATALMQKELYALPCQSFTITHIDLSPDLRNAKIFIMPLGGEHPQETIAYLDGHKRYFKDIIATKMKLKFIPEIVFKYDDSLEYSAKIEALLHNSGM